MPPFVFMAIVALAVLFQYLLYLARNGKMGKVGRAIRLSDHEAWEMAVKEKEAEIESLAERIYNAPNHIFERYAQWDVDDAVAELETLKGMEPKLYPGDE